MSVIGRIATRLLKLPPAETSRYTVERNVPVTMPDGVVLLGTHFAPVVNHPCPTILVRTPYGRSGPIVALTVVPYVERGYHVFVQSCRGTDGSGGEFTYVRDERADGLATIAWLKRQAWYTGELALLGASYYGFTQWAVAADVDEDVKALVLAITTSDPHHRRIQGGALVLENMLSWAVAMTQQAATGMRLTPGAIRETRQRAKNLERAYLALPLDQADRLAIGRPSSHYQEWFAHTVDDPYWNQINFSGRVGEVVAPVALQAGWFDQFVDWQIQDYERLRDAGRRPSLLIGPWYHGQLSGNGPMTNDGLAWLDAKVKGKTAGLRQPVRIYVMGAEEWRDYPDWPPASQPQRWNLQPQGALDPAAPPAVGDPDRYHYDPANPTPAVGGNSLGAQQRMGQQDNRTLESRADVLTYTSAPLTRDLEIIGSVTADLYVASSLEYTDFFARLCVVEPSGKSLNLCDSIQRLTPENFPPDGDGIRHIEIRLWPTAYHFKPGQRIRAQISSGAHPRFARNTGTGEPMGTTTTLVAAEQAIYHDAARPSAFILPLVG